MALKLVIYLALLIASALAEKHVFESNKGTMDLEGDSLVITCKGLDLITSIFPPLKTKISIKNVTISQCNLPTKPLTELLQTLNINTTVIDTLGMNYNNIEAIQENFTTGLNVQSLEFKIERVLFTESIAFVESLKPLMMPSSNVKRLTVSGIELPELPTHLEALEINKASVHSWNNCKHLQELTISGIHDVNEKVIKEWPKNCSLLNRFRLIDMGPSEALRVASVLIAGSPNLRSITLESCGLVEFPFEKLPEQLEHLDLSHNYLQDVDFDQFPMLRDLTSLDLSHNRLNGMCLVNLVPKLPRLRNLTLDGNSFMKFYTFDVFGENSIIVNLTSLERLSMNDMWLEADCFNGAHFVNLKFLSLTSKEPIEKLWLMSFPSTDAPQLKVDLRGRSIGSVPIHPDQFSPGKNKDQSTPWFVTTGTKVTVLTNIIDCECINAGLAKVLHAYPKILSMPGAKCNTKTGNDILSEPLENFECDKVDCFHYDCICKEKRSWMDMTSVFDCSYQMREEFDWQTIVRQSKPRGVNVAGNLLTKPPVHDNLEWLDLRNNHISRLNVEESAQLFGSRERRLWLAGNPIVCECSNRALLNALRINQSQVVDYNELTCAETGQPLRHVSTIKLCHVNPKLMDFVWGICCAGSLLSVILMLFLRRYGKALRMILYSRGWCSSCLRNKIDADRPYDAFISFAHGDEKFVMDHLMPRLEDGPEQFKVCVHYRDWVVGEWIPAQIMNSVRASKRTIIVLSRNFVRSWWGVLEFRYAHASAMSEGRSRLIVLVLDDVLSEKLAPEMQGYLEYHTFLRCDDPWFWEKLKYGMPRNNGDDCEVQEFPFPHTKV